MVRTVSLLLAALWTVTAAAFWFGWTGKTGYGALHQTLDGVIPGRLPNAGEDEEMPGVPVSNANAATRMAFAPADADPHKILAFYLTGDRDAAPFVNIPAIGPPDQLGSARDTSNNCSNLPIVNLAIVDRQTSSAAMVFDAPVFVQGFGRINGAGGSKLLLRTVQKDTNRNGLLDCGDYSTFSILDLGSATLTPVQIPPTDDSFEVTTPVDGLMFIYNENQSFAFGNDGVPDAFWGRGELAVLGAGLLAPVGGD